MVQDANVQSKAYHKQGGDEYVIASGGVNRIESGGTQTVESGGVVALESGATITVAAGASVRSAVVAGTTAATGVIPPAGIATVNSTGKAEVFLMTGAPTAGDRLDVSCLKATSTGTCTLKAALGVTFSSTAAKRLLVFNTDNVMATLVAVSATRYALTNSTAYVATAT